GMGSEADARRQLVALFPKKKTAAESLPTTPRSPLPSNARPRSRSVPPVSLVVGPSSGASELRVGESVDMTVRRSDTPNTDAGQSTTGVVWQTSDEQVVKITADGRATARRTGFVTIIATDGSLTGSCVMSIVAADERPIEAKRPISIAA